MIPTMAGRWRAVLVALFLVALALGDLLLAVGEGSTASAPRDAEQAALARLEAEINQERETLQRLAFPAPGQVRNLVLELIKAQQQESPIQVDSYSTTERSTIIAGRTYTTVQSGLGVKGPLADLLAVLERLWEHQAASLVVESVQVRRVMDLWSLTLVVKVYSQEPG